MKTLYIVRHAHAGEHSALHDFERELTDRGKLNAAAMAGALSERKISVNLVLASPAARTYATSLALCAGLNYPEDAIATDRHIYNSEYPALLKILQNSDDKNSSIMLVGHNPGVTEFANSIFNILITSMATCGVIAGTIPIDSWQELKWGGGTFSFYLTPDHLTP